MGARPGTSGGWSRAKSGVAPRVIIVAGGRRCGPRVSIWSSTGGRTGCTCSARCWRGRGAVRAFRRRRAGGDDIGDVGGVLRGMGGVPKVVLADRMGCLKGGVVANVVVPDPDYVRFATHYGFRPDFCEGPTRSRRDRGEPGRLRQDRSDGPRLEPAASRSPTWPRRTPRPRRGATRSTPRSTRRSARCPPSGWSPRWSCSPAAVAAAGIGQVVTRKVDRLSCVRFGSARYSVPVRLIGATGPAAGRRPRPGW